MNGQQPPWRDKVQELFQTCSEELKRTTKIGKKMLTATKTNTQLHECYEELGQLIYKAVTKEGHEWENPKARELINLIKSCRHDLKAIEEDVIKIKETRAD